jgi:YVTN family beta-propeller protein
MRHARYKTLNTVVLVASVLPNVWYKRAAERQDRRTVKIGLLISIAFAIAFIVIRVFEFRALNCRWDTNAYGSVVWTLLGFHTTHLVTDFLDTCVLTVLMFTGPIEGKRFGDVSENAFYWYFVVAVWVRPMGIAVSRNGRHLYVANGRGNSVAVIDGKTQKILAMIPVAGRPWGIAITPDGRKVYTANGLSNDVAVIDTETNRVIKTIQAGNDPWGIVIAH